MNFLFLINVGVLSAMALGTWWLTGFDKTAGGESRRGEILGRAFRCLAVVLLSGVCLWVVESPGLGYGDIPILIIIPMAIAVVLRSSISELFAHGFSGWWIRRSRAPRIRSQEGAALSGRHRAPHPPRTAGTSHQAVRGAQGHRRSGHRDAGKHLGVSGREAGSSTVVPPLVQADRLRKAGKFAEAEQVLRSLLAADRTDAGAGVMLIRLYAEDLRQPERAQALLEALEKVPHVSRDHLEFARRSIAEWSQAPSAPPSGAPAVAKSVDELVARGSFGLAVERLEDLILAQPGDFALQFKLAQVYANHCHNRLLAVKLLQQIIHHPQAPGRVPARCGDGGLKLFEVHFEISHDISTH